MSDIVGQIALELNLDSGKFRKSLKNLNKTADNAAKSMKSSFSGAFKKIAGAAAAAFSAAAVIKFGKDCVNQRQALMPQTLSFRKLSVIYKAMPKQL